MTDKPMSDEELFAKLANAADDLHIALDRTTDVDERRRRVVDKARAGETAARDGVSGSG